MNKRWISHLGLAVMAVVLRAVCGLADVTLYDDGTWRVDGAADPAPDARPIAVTVGTTPAGAFSQLKVYQVDGSGAVAVALLNGRGAMQAIPLSAAEFGGTFYLSRLWDCFRGLSPDLAFTELVLQPNTKGTGTLTFTGRLDNGVSLASTDLRLQLSLADGSNLQINARYTLVATASICIDPWHAQWREEFQIARLTTNYVSPAINDNDGVRAYGVIDKFCDCCDCWKVTGSVCAPFADSAGYLFEPPLAMTKPWVFAQLGEPSPGHTPVLKIAVKKPTLKRLWAQGYLAATLDPAAENAVLWVNWSTSKESYEAGKKIQKCDITFSARIPEPFSCDVLTPPQP